MGRFGSVAGRGAGLLSLAILAACGDGGLRYQGELGSPTPATVVEGGLAITATVSGAGTGTFLLDTGAPFSMIDTGAFPGVEPGRTRAELEAFELLFPRLNLAALDVFPGSSSGAALDGILGGDVLAHFALSLDYQEPRAWLRDGYDGALPRGVAPAQVLAPQVIDARVRGGGRAKLPGECPGGCGALAIGRTRFLVELTVEDGEPLTALVDTGASWVLLDEAVLQALGDRGRPRLDGVTVATASGPADAYFTRVGRLGLEAQQGEVARKSVAALVIPDTDLFEVLQGEVGVTVSALLGGSFLRRYLTTVDYPERRLVLEPYTAGDPVGQSEFVRVGFTLARAGSSWTVADVFSGTDAEAEGLKVGETIADIDGTEIAPLDSDGVSALLAGFSLGEQVPVGVQRGAGVETLLIEVEDLLPSFEVP